MRLFGAIQIAHHETARPQCVALWFRIAPQRRAAACTALPSRLRARGARRHRCSVVDLSLQIGIDDREVVTPVHASRVVGEGNASLVEVKGKQTCGKLLKTRMLGRCPVRDRFPRATRRACADHDLSGPATETRGGDETMYGIVPRRPICMSSR